MLARVSLQRLHFASTVGRIKAAIVVAYTAAECGWAHIVFHHRIGAPDRCAGILVEGVNCAVRPDCEQLVPADHGCRRQALAIAGACNARSPSTLRILRKSEVAVAFAGGTADLCPFGIGLCGRQNDADAGQGRVHRGAAFNPRQDRRALANCWRDLLAIACATGKHRAQDASHQETASSIDVFRHHSVQIKISLCHHPYCGNCVSPSCGFTPSSSSNCSTSTIASTPSNPAIWRARLRRVSG